MGYIYDSKGELCCDFCGKPGAQKYKCPFGWCQPIAACLECRKKNTKFFGKKYHRQIGCELNKQKAIADSLRRQDALNAGKYIRTAAIRVNENIVKVIFENKEGQETAYLMSLETYKKIPIGITATVEDFMSLGEIKKTCNTKLC